MHAQSEEQFAALVGDLAADPGRRRHLAELLREDHAVYDQRSTAATSRMRGWILAALSGSGLSDGDLIFVLDELDTGLDPYTVAAAARALRSYPRASAAFAPLLMRALANIRYRDEPVSFARYGEYATDSSDNTTPVRELLTTLAWLGPHARGVLPELEPLRTQGVARKHAAQFDQALTAIREVAPAGDSGSECCTLPSMLSWPLGSRASPQSIGHVVFEDHDGIRATFDELFRGRPSIVFFFYTRCDNPLKCSLSITKLARVQQLLASRGLDGRISTAAITYDPAFDLPERLQGYAQARGVRLDARNRMLRTVDDLSTVRRHFRLGVNFVQSLVNRHQIEVYVLDREGRVAASFQRLRWEEEQVVDRAAAALEEKEERVNRTAPATAVSLVGTLAAFAVAFLPKCPMCWGAYLSLFGIAGLQGIPSAPWLRPVLGLLVLMNVLSVWLRSRATGRMMGLYFVAIGALSIAVAAARPNWKIAAAIGVILTMVGSLVSAWRSRTRRPSPFFSSSAPTPWESSPPRNPAP